MANVTTAGMFTMAPSSTKTNVFQVTTWQFIWYTLIFLVGGPGNIIIIYIICKSGNAFRAALFNKYLLSLAVADCLTAFTALPIYLMSSSPFKNPGRKLGEIFCKVNGFVFLFWMAETSVFLITGMSIERLKAITSPLLSTTDHSPLCTRLSIAAAWTASFLIVLNNIQGNSYDPDHPTEGQYCNSRVWPNLTGSRVIYSIIFISTYIIPLLVITYTSFKIRRYVLNQESTLLGHMSGSNSSHVNQKKIIKKRKRTVRSLFLVVVSFFISWTPYRISFFLLDYEPGRYHWNSTPFQVFMLMGFSSSFINCFLYSFQSADFRKQFHKLCPNMYSRLKTIGDSTISHNNNTNNDKDSERKSILIKQKVYTVLR